MQKKREVSAVVSDIIAIRKRIGMTQKELANLSGVTRLTIHRIENGETSPTLSVIINVLDALGRELKVIHKKK